MLNEWHGDINSNCFDGSLEDFATKIILTRIIFRRIFLCIHIPELILPGLMNDMVTLILIASMALWKISPHVINVSIIRILTARLVAVVCYYVSVHCAGPSEYNGDGWVPTTFFRFSSTVFLKTTLQIKQYFAKMCITIGLPLYLWRWLLWNYWSQPIL